MTDQAPAPPRDIPDTPAGRALGWYLGPIDGSTTLTLEDGQPCPPAFAARFAPGAGEDNLRQAWGVTVAREGEIVRFAVEDASDFKITAELRMADGRRWGLPLEVEAQPPHRITGFRWERRHDFVLDVREATDADAHILADIERRCPIVLGDTSLYFDRGSDYLAFTRLMADCSIGIASVDGVPAAVSCGAKHTVRIGGVLRPMVTVSHLRVLPEHQRKGLWGAANRILDKYWDNVDGSNAYISVDNAGMQHGFTNTSNKWGQLVLRAQLPCAALAGPPAGRAATPADAEVIARRLNAFHGAEEMFAPYTAASLRERLERSPGQYSWDKVWLTEAALVGVWPAGEALKVVTETRGVRSESVRGVVLDYAFDPGAEGQFEALLRAWCGWAAARGIDTLSVFTSPASPGVEVLTTLAREVERYNMWTPGIPVPEGEANKGLYVDPIYF